MSNHKESAVSNKVPAGWTLSERTADDGRWIGTHRAPGGHNDFELTADDRDELVRKIAAREAYIAANAVKG